MEFRFDSEPRCHEIDIDIPVPLVGMMVPENAVHDPFYTLLLVVYPDLQIIVPSEYGIHHETVREILFDSCLYDVYRFLQLVLEFSLKHHSGSDRFERRLL